MFSPSSARVAGGISSCARGTAAASQKRVPLSVTISRVKQAALAVADQHQVAQGRILTVRVDLRDGLAQRLAQLTGREQNRIARVVGEEPELDALVQHRVVLQLVEISPSAPDSRRCRGSAPRALRPRRYGWTIISPSRNSPVRRQEAAEFGVPHRCAFEHVGQRRARLELQRERCVRRRPPWWPRRPRTARCGPAPRRWQCRLRTLSRRTKAVTGTLMRGGNALARRVGGRPLSQRAQLRRQRSAHARLAVAIPETPQLELGHRDEVGSSDSRPR